MWRRASRYDAANGTVLGWIIARSRAIDRLRFDSRKKRIHGGDEQPPAEVAADPSDVMELREQSGRCARVDSAHATADVLRTWVPEQSCWTNRWWQAARSMA